MTTSFAAQLALVQARVVSKENIHPAPASGFAFAFACAFGFGLVTPPDDFADLALALVVAAGVFAFAFFTLGGAGMGGGVAAVSGVPESASATADGTHLCFTAAQCVHEAAILLVPALAPLPFWIQSMQACPLATQYVHAGTRGPTGEH
jgi:hypothetical protein